MAFGGFSWTGVIDALLFDVWRQSFTGIEPLFQLGVCYIASDDDRAGER